MPNSPFVFIDTNVLFSAFYGSVNAEMILKAHINGEITMVISQQVLRELIKNIQIKIPDATSSLKIFLKAAPPKIIKDPEKISQLVKDCSDYKDQKILQSAVNGKATTFVTGNLKHFNGEKIAKYYSIKIMSPSEAVKDLL